jgi:hypothetical protein
LEACNQTLNGIKPTCSVVGLPCKSEDGIEAGCPSGYQCVIAPASKKDMCVASRDCDVLVNDVKTQCTAPVGGTKCDAEIDGKGCPDGMNCVTAPENLAKTCVAHEACDKLVGAIKTVCGATTLSASITAAFMVASTM